MCSADVLRLNHPSRYGNYIYWWVAAKERKMPELTRQIMMLMIQLLVITRDLLVLFYKKEYLDPFVCVCVLLCFIII